MPAYKLNVTGASGFDAAKFAAIIQALLPVLMQIAGMFSGERPTLAAGNPDSVEVTCEPLDDDE